MYINKNAHICFLIAVSFVSLAFGGGSAEDYQRADELGGRFRNKVYRSDVEPNWFERNSYFWYKVKAGAGEHEFVLVDAQKGERKEAFDHVRLAKALKGKGVKGANAKQLGMEKLEFDVGGNTITFQLGDKVWECELETYELTLESEAKEVGLKGFVPGDAPRRSGENGRDTEITFVNRTDDFVELFWVDSGGGRQSYGKLKAGESRGQHTFGNHVWLVVDSAGQEIAVFRAEYRKGKALIGGEGKLRRLSEERGRRGNGGRRGRDAGAGSGDGKWRAFIKDYNVWVKRVDGGQEIQLSKDGVAGEGYAGRFYWSGDSKRLVVIRRKDEQEHKVYYVESAPKGQLQPKLHSVQYLKPGDDVAIEKPCLFDIETLKQVEVSDELFSNPYKISGVRWEANSSGFTFLYNQRGHQVLRVVGVDAVSGKTRAVIDERSDTFICYSYKYFAEYVDETDEIVWMSERDGWNHLYLYDSETGKVKNQITEGEWVVRSVDLVDRDKRQIWFRAGGIRAEQDPYYVHYCRVNFDGSGLVVLTEGEGNHRVEFSPGRKYFVDTWSRVDMSPVVELRESSTGKLVCELERADWSELVEAGWQKPERFAAKGRDGETDIYGVIYRPTNFDAGKSYPVIENIYAGPHGHFVPKEFRAYSGLQKMAELGFIVVKCDGMGTNWRSKKFHDVCWKNLKDSGLPDRIAWIKSAAKKYRYMDVERVGIYGGSAGGQSSTCAVMTHGDFYKVAVSDCGCHDNRMDKIWWNEQWMGWPVDDSYEANSNVTLAKGLKGKLLLIVGEMDKNVDPASTMQVVGALIKADKDFDMLVVPGAGHGAAGGKYGSRRQSDYFVRHLLGVEPRWK